jgi:hypothetical protein
MTQARQATEGWRLDRLLAHRRWWFGSQPFPHVVARQVFVPAFYERLVGAVEAALPREDPAAYNAKHDFTGLSLRSGTRGPLSVFLSREWHDLFAGLFGIETSGQVAAGLHRHVPGSRNGFPHNDIVPEELAGLERSDEVIRLRSPGVDGRGRPHAAGMSVRAIAVLFYLNNGPWRHGDGGETGLYDHWRDPVTDAVARVPPVDNSLLAFECSPLSYHSFITNRTRRDSVIVFVYRTLDSYLDVWGEDGLNQYADG